MLFAGAPLPAPRPAEALVQRAELWRTVSPAHGEELEMAVFAIESHHPSEALDTLIRWVVDEEIVGMIIVPPSGAWLYHPYDGGADVAGRSRRSPRGFRSVALDAPARALSTLGSLLL